MSTKNRHPLVLLLFTLLLTFTFSASNVYAQSPSEIQHVEDSINGIMDFPINTTGPKLEYTHLWFKQMFGSFIFGPWESMGIDNGNYKEGDQTVLAKALGFTNILAIIICLVIGYYLIVGGAINTAAKGEVLGQNWDGPWLAIRTSIGFGMLVPLKGIGGLTLSFSQVAIIWLIMIGSNAATLLWNMIGEEILSGTDIVQSNIRPSYTEVGALASMLVCSELSVIDQSRVYASPDTSGNSFIPGGVGGLLGRASGGATHLVEKSYLNLASVHYSNGTTDSMSALKPSVESHGYFENSGYWKKTGTQKFPNGSSSVIGAVIHRDQPKKQITKINFGGGCGTISFPTSAPHEPAIGDDWGETKASTYKVSAKISAGQAYAKIILDTLNDLLKMIDIIHTKDEYYSKDIRQLFKDSKGISDKVAEKHAKFHEKFVGISNTYFKRVNTEIHAASVGNSNFIDKVREEMMYGGWAAAGIWFIELSTIPAIPYQAYASVRDSLKFSTSDVCPISRNGTAICREINEFSVAFNSILKESIRFASESKEADPSTYSSGIDQVSVPCDVNGKCQSPDSINERLSTTYSRDILGWLGSSNEGAMNPFNDDQSLASPFLFLSEIGSTLNNASYGLFFGVAMLNSASDYVDGLLKQKDKTILGIAGNLSHTNFAAYAWYGFPLALAKNSLSILVAGLIAAGVSLMSSGFLLAYVIPFMPITTWILMMAGYMLTVVESIAAAPLAIVLLFTPEGSGIAGSRFERALNLVTMAILRPSFMILGLIASITVSFVAFSMMNTFFFKAAEHIVTGHLFDTVAVTLIYVSLSYQLAKMMVENMHQLPDRIGEWFAGGVSRQFGESRVNETAESAVQGAASKFTAMPNSAMSMQGAARETRSKEKEASSIEEKKE